MFLLLNSIEIPKLFVKHSSNSFGMLLRYF